MAIDRSIFNGYRDDDGSGTFGSLWNKSAIQSIILDPADAAYANKYDTWTTDGATGVLNVWAPTLAGHTVVVWNGAADLTIHGLAGGVAGQRVTIKNFGQGIIFVAFYSNAAPAGQKLHNYVSSAPTPIAVSGSAMYVYDGATWVLVAHEQGAWITPPYSAAHYGAGGANWNVTAAGREVHKYCLRGRTLHALFGLNSTSVDGGTPAQLYLFSSGFGGYSFPHVTWSLQPIGRLDQGGAVPGSFVQVIAPTVIVISRGDLGVIVGYPIHVWAGFSFEVA